MPTEPLSVLFADVSGSTRLYESHGDDAARTAIAECVGVMASVARAHDGRLVKTIGDEIMCVFQSPARAVMAANEMQIAVRSAGEAGRFVTGPLRIKIGLHLGPGVERDDDVYGDAAIVAQAVIEQAKADQILASAELCAVLPPELKVGTRRFDRIEAEGRAGLLEVVELIWEVEGVTQMVDTGAVERLPGHERLRLRYEGEEIELGAGRARLTIGRTEQNELVVPVQLASRSHAEITFRRGRFMLRDMSSNGTVVVTDDGEASTLRGESVQLFGRGTFCLGGPPDQNPAGVIEYECE